MSTRQLAGQPRGWPAPAGLVALSAVPLAADALPLVQLPGQPDLVPADARFTGFRRSHPMWHRRAGRLFLGAGLVVVDSALWLALLYEVQPGTGDPLYVPRLVFAPAMAAGLILGLTTLRRRDIAAHRAWMTRAYARGLAAGTQPFTEGIAAGMIGAGQLRSDLAKGTGWLTNLSSADWVIRRPARQRNPRRPHGSTSVGSPERAPE